MAACTRAVAVVVAVAARVALGVLWLREGLVKYHAGFGAADIRLVVDSTASNPRVPSLYQAFTEHVLANVSTLFGVAVPLLETALGIALVLGLLTRAAVCVSIGTLMTYWLADQLVGQYPVMVSLSVVVLLAPVAATRWSVTRLLAHALRDRPRCRAVTEGQAALWL